MSTRASFIICRNNVDKELYNHYDGYPDYTGREIIRIVKTLNLDQVFAHLVPVESEETDFSARLCERASNGENVGYRQMNGWFIADSLMCEYAYRIDLDHETFEFYTGFQDKPQEGHRFGTDYQEGRDGTRYYPCGLRGVFSLDFIRGTETDELVDIMENLAEEKSETIQQFGMDAHEKEGMTQVSRKVMKDILKYPELFRSFGEPVMTKAKNGDGVVCMSEAMYRKLVDLADEKEKQSN